MDGSCHDCETYCWSCEGSSDNCTSCLGDNEDPENRCDCIKGSYYSNGRCLKKCSIGCLLCNSVRGECEKCDV